MIRNANDKKYDYFIFGGMSPLSSTTINRYKKEACEKANIRLITLRQFRHNVNLEQEKRVSETLNSLRTCIPTTEY